MQPTYKGVIIHLLSTMDIPVYIYVYFFLAGGGGNYSDQFRRLRSPPNGGESKGKCPNNLHRYMCDGPYGTCDIVSDHMYMYIYINIRINIQ